MPKSKSNKVVHLTQVKKKGKDHKEDLLKQLEQYGENFERVYVFDFEHTKSDRIMLLRTRLKEYGRIFSGKNSLVSLALRNLGSRSNSNFDDLIKQVSGHRGLLFTDLPVDKLTDLLSEELPEFRAKLLGCAQIKRSNVPRSDDDDDDDDEDGDEAESSVDGDSEVDENDEGGEEFSDGDGGLARDAESSRKGSGLRKRRALTQESAGARKVRLKQAKKMSATKKSNKSLERQQKRIEIASSSKGIRSAHKKSNRQGKDQSAAAPGTVAPLSSFAGEEKAADEVGRKNKHAKKSTACIRRHKVRFESLR